MRKVEEGQDIVGMVESDVTGTTAGLVISTFARALIKLH